MEKRRPRTLLIGWDAVNWEYLNPLLIKGNLPTLQKLIQEGVRGELRSTIPAITPVAWSTITTGKNPGKHGVFDWTWRKPGTWQFSPFTGAQRIGKPWWKYLNENGLRVGLVNIPLSYPPSPIDGFIVCDFGAPSSASNLTYPESLQNELGKKYLWRGGVNSENEISHDNLVSLFNADRDKQEQHIHVSILLAERYDVDVLAVNLMLLDHTNHIMGDKEYVEKALVICDQHLSQLIEGYNPDHILLFSDHGARRVDGAFLLSSWLHEKGDLVWMPRQNINQNFLNWYLTSWLEQFVGFSGNLLHVTRTFLRELLWRLPGNLNRWVLKTISANKPALMEHYLYEDQIDIANTKIFPTLNGSIYLNVIGRDQHGVIPPDKKNTVINELRDKLGKVTDPATGKPIFSSIHIPQEIYHGPMTKFAPDLILEFNESRWIMLCKRKKYINPTGGYFAPPEVKGWFGAHADDGIFVCKGGHLKHDHRLRIADLLDIPATLLYLYGIPIPEDWDGIPRRDWFTPEYNDQFAITTQPGDEQEGKSLDNEYSKLDMDDVTSRLKALGYLD
jgi:predicted AlkP superfamily phosphohydrolase/phosphomutase